MQTSDTGFAQAPSRSPRPSGAPGREQAAAVVANRTVVLEAAGAGALALALALALAPADAGLGSRAPHVAWLAVLVLAARYGSRGLVLSAPLAWGMVAIAALLLGRAPALAARASNGADLMALVAAVLVAWVASTHEHRHVSTTDALASMRLRAAADRAAATSLQEAVAMLRARADRLELSLTFLRDVATRIDCGEPVVAARAALELAMARTGARAGVVQLRSGSAAGGLELAPAGAAAQALIASGAWTPDGNAIDLSSDRAVTAALRGRRPVRAIDLNGATPAECDLAAPVLDGTGAPRGVMALRGVPHAGASMATLHDLAIVAVWLAQALERDSAARGGGFDDDDDEGVAGGSGGAGGGSDLGGDGGRGGGGGSAGELAAASELALEVLPSTPPTVDEQI